MNSATYRTRAGAFTLIELLVVMAIIAVLYTLVAPAIDQMMARADSLACVSNLRQLFVAAQAAATDNDNKYPAIELDPTNPIFKPEDNAHTLAEALKPYGIVEKGLQCATDMKKGSESNFRKYGSSYKWEPVSEEENPIAITIYTPRGQFPGKLNRIRLARDWQGIHPGNATAGNGLRPNTLYADGHVQESSARVTRTR